MMFLLVVSIRIQEFRRSLGRIFELHLLFLKRSSWSVKRCIFSLATGYKRPTIPDEFKALTVLRILGRNHVAASVKEILGCGMSTINVWF